MREYLSIVSLWIDTEKRIENHSNLYLWFVISVFFHPRAMHSCSVCLEFASVGKIIFLVIHSLLSPKTNVRFDREKSYINQKSFTSKDRLFALNRISSLFLTWQYSTFFFFGYECGKHNGSINIIHSCCAA